MRILPHDVIYLIHYVELSKAGWWETSVEHCVLAVMWLLKGPVNAQQVRKEIRTNLGIDIKAQELRESLGRLEQNESVIRLSDGRYRLSIEKNQELSKCVESANALEEKVKEKFFRRMKNACPLSDPKSVWDSFIESLLIPLVVNEGARVYEVFSGPKKPELVNSYIGPLHEQIPVVDRDKTIQAIHDFIAEDDVEVARFLLSYLDAYFLLSASGLPPSVLKTLMAIIKEPVEFVVFVDTNFVFSILGLHDNPSNEAANDLMELVHSASEDLSFQFVIKQSTLDETQSSISHHKRQLGNARYPPNLAEAATQTEIRGIYETFLERTSRAGQSISAEEYFALYENNLVRLLAEKGVTVFPEKSRTGYEQTYEVTEDIERQAAFERDRFGIRAKTENQIRHDIVLWHFVQDLRDRKLAVHLQAKWWIVTVDYRFLSFDRFKTSKGTLSPACMHPSQLIQVLRFFVPRSPQFEKTLLAVMRLPIVAREFDTEAERVSLRILRSMARHEGIEDLQTDTLVSVFADTAVRDRFATSAISEEEANEVIQNSLAQQLHKHELFIEEQSSELDDLREQVQHLKAVVEGHQEKEQEQSVIQSRAQSEKRMAEHKATELSDAKQRLQQKVDRYGLILRSIIGVIFATLGIGGILWVPGLVSWKWFIEHSHKLGLQISVIVACIGVCWIIVDTNKTHRWFAFSSIFLAALFVVIQII